MVYIVHMHHLHNNQDMSMKAYDLLHDMKHRFHMIQDKDYDTILLNNIEF